MGKYGSITWDLPYSAKHVANTKIVADVTVTNLDINPRWFSLVVMITQNQEGVNYVIYEQPLMINNEEWFYLVGKETINIPVIMIPATVPVLLTLCLKEQKTQEYTDEQSISLVRGTSVNDIDSIMVIALLASMFVMMKVD